MTTPKYRCSVNWCKCLGVREYGPFLQFCAWHFARLLKSGVFTFIALPWDGPDDHVCEGET